MRAEGMMGIPRGMGSKDVTTPNTPSTNIRTAPTFQRMHDSSKAGDKESGGGRE